MRRVQTTGSVRDRIHKRTIGDNYEAFLGIIVIVKRNNCNGECFAGMGERLTSILFIGRVYPFRRGSPTRPESKRRPRVLEEQEFRPVTRQAPVAPGQRAANEEGSSQSTVFITVAV